MSLLSKDQSTNSRNGPVSCTTLGQHWSEILLKHSTFHEHFTITFHPVPYLLISFSIIVWFISTRFTWLHCTHFLWLSTLIYVVMLTLMLTIWFLKGLCTIMHFVLYSHDWVRFSCTHFFFCVCVGVIYIYKVFVLDILDKGYTEHYGLSSLYCILYTLCI